MATNTTSDSTTPYNPPTPPVVTPAPVVPTSIPTPMPNAFAPLSLTTPSNPTSTPSPNAPSTMINGFQVPTSMVTPSLTSYLNSLNKSGSGDQNGIQSSSGVATSATTGAALGAGATAAAGGTTPTGNGTNNEVPAGNTTSSGSNDVYAEAKNFGTSANTNLANIISATNANTAAVISNIQNTSAITASLYSNQLQQLMLQQSNSIGQFTSAAAAMNPYAHNSPTVAAGVAAIGQKYALLAQNISQNAELAQTTAQGQEVQASTGGSLAIAQTTESITKDIASVMTNALDIVRQQNNFNSTLTNQNNSDLRSMISTGQTGLSEPFLDNLNQTIANGGQLTPTQTSTLLTSTGGLMAIKNGVLNPNDPNSIMNYANTVGSGYTYSKQQGAYYNAFTQSQELQTGQQMSTYLQSNPVPSDFGTNPSTSLTYAANVAQQSSGFNVGKPLDQTISKTLQDDETSISGIRTLGVQLQGMSDTDVTSMGSSLKGALESMMNEFSSSGHITIGNDGTLQGIQMSTEALPIAIGYAKALNGGRTNLQEVKGVMANLGANLSNPTWMRQDLIKNTYSVAVNGFATDLYTAASGKNDVSNFSSYASSLTGSLSKMGITDTSGGSGASGAGASGGTDAFSNWFNSGQ